jgi:hypothetical protein
MAENENSPELGALRPLTLPPSASLSPGPLKVPGTRVVRVGRNAR